MCMYVRVCVRALAMCVSVMYYVCMCVCVCMYVCIDVLSASSLGNKISYYENLGNGTFSQVSVSDSALFINNYAYVNVII